MVQLSQLINKNGSGLAEHSVRQEHTVFTDMDLKLNITGEFSKRAKVLNSQGVWVDTAPLVISHEPVQPIEPKPLAFKGISPSGVSNITAKLLRAYLKRAGLVKPRAYKPSLTPKKSLE